jgi:hypothetical protein
MTMAFSEPNGRPSSVAFDGPGRHDDYAGASGSVGLRLHDSWAIAERRSLRLKARRATEREYRLVSSVAFVIFLAVATFARLLPGRLRARVTGAEGRSILADARAMTANTIPIAFMA